jgi:hypothetical protein
MVNLTKKIELILTCINEEYDEVQRIIKVMEVYCYLDLLRLEETKENIYKALKYLESMERTKEDYKDICKECFSLNE